MSRRGLIALECATTLAVLAAAAIEKGHAGIQKELFFVLLLTLPLHLQRIVGARPTILASLLELAALVGLFLRYPPPAWAMSAAAFSGLLEGSRHDGLELRARAAKVVALALAAATAYALVRRTAAPGSDHDFSPDMAALAFPLAALALLEAIVPGSPSSFRATLRRIAAAVLCLVASRADGFPLEVPALVWAGATALGWLAVARVPDERKHTARRRYALRLGVPTLFLVLAWALAEGVFAVVPNCYRELVPYLPPENWHAPGKSSLYEGALLRPRQPHPVMSRWNGEGFRDLDRDHAKPAGTARVLVLGDSYVEGIQVEFDELYHRRLERSLAAQSSSRVEVIALGHSGWGQIDERLALEERGLDYEPDLVLVEFLPFNDVRNNQLDLEQLANEEGLNGTFARSLFVDAVNARLWFSACVLDHLDQAIRNLEGRRDVVDADVYRERPRAHAALWDEAWKRTEDLLAYMKRAIARRGGRLVVVVFAARPEIEACAADPQQALPADLDFRRPARLMREICSRNEIPFLDLAPRFGALAAADRARINIMGDGHWSPFGHERAAAETVHFLKEETSLWKEALERAHPAGSR